MYEQLIKSYSEIQSNNVEREDTIFDICGFPHYETVASNVLAFFLSNNKEHELGTLLLDSLIALIYEDNIVFDNDYYVEREAATSKGNFIDIMIYDSKTAIVIENKIFAGLNNEAVSNS